VIRDNEQFGRIGELLVLREDGPIDVPVHRDERQVFDSRIDVARNCSLVRINRKSAVGAQDKWAIRIHGNLFVDGFASSRRAVAASLASSCKKMQEFAAADILHCVSLKTEAIQGGYCAGDYPRRSKRSGRLIVYGVASLFSS